MGEEELLKSNKPLWPIWQVILALVVCEFMSSYLAGMAAVLSTDTSLQVLIASVVQYGLFILAAWLIVSGRGRQNVWRRLGFKRLPLDEILIKGVGLGFVTYLFMIAVSFINNLIFEGEIYMQDISQLILNENRPLAIIGLCFCVIVLAPIGEEIFFRGLLFKALNNKFGAGAAIIFSGLLFAALHLSIYAFLPLVATGIALAYIFYKSESLWVSITAHATINSISTFFLIIS